MNRLQTVVFVVIGLLASTAVWADADDPQVQNLKAQLNLTEQQTQELRKIFKETRFKRKVLGQEILDLYKNMRERINGVLTEEQAKKYEQMRRELPKP